MASIDGLKKSNISELRHFNTDDFSTMLVLHETYPDNVSTPRLISCCSSMSRGPPNLIYDVFVTSRNVGFVLCSKLWIIASMNSSLLNREPRSLSDDRKCKTAAAEQTMLTFEENTCSKVDVY